MINEKRAKRDSEAWHTRTTETRKPCSCSTTWRISRALTTSARGSARFGSTPRRMSSSCCWATRSTNPIGSLPKSRARNSPRYLETLLFIAHFKLPLFLQFTSFYLEYLIQKCYFWGLELYTLLSFNVQ